MTENTVYDVLCEIYAVFQRTAPVRNARIVSKLAEKCEDIPDYVAEYIEDSVTQQKALPVNMVQAFRDAWNSYCLANPEAAGDGPTCPVCSGDGGWEAWEPMGEGKTHHFFALCPKCRPRKDGRKYPHPYDLQRRGCLVMPHGYPGGRLAFEKAHGLEPMGTTDVGRSMIDLRARMASRRIQPGYAEA